MKGIAITQPATTSSNISSLTTIELPTPVATDHDLLVGVQAISVNPVDTKVRAGFNAGEPRVLGRDSVGSILTQLVSRLTGLTVIGTVSRPESQQWVRERGAHHVIDHSNPLTEQLARIGVTSVTHVASLITTAQHCAQIIEALAPQGKLALIDDPDTLDARPLKAKSLSLHWEFMFTRPMFGTGDMIARHQLLTRVACLIDDGVLKTTLGEHYGAITAENLQKAHRQIETGRMMGKIVLEGF